MPAFDDEIDQAARIEKTGRLADGEHGRVAGGAEQRRRARRLRPRHEQHLAERRRGIRAEHFDRDRTAGRLFAGYRALEHAAERILARQAEAEWLARAQRFRRPLDELDEVVEERRLHLVFEAALGVQVDWPPGRENRDEDARSEHAARPEPSRRACLEPSRRTSQKRHVTWPNTLRGYSSRGVRLPNSGW